MAKKIGVWGIDIGHCAVKALRCVSGDNPGEIIADRYDYFEFPKMLSQMESDSDEAVKEALQTFLSRNEVKGDFVCVSVPGQSGLSRFFRPPPVDAKTLPDIVKYEVKQQIPFPLEDVIWDWQQLGGSIVDDRLVDAEVGLFAMKREAVYRQLKPFDDAGIEVDFVQLSPLAIYNYVTYDVMETLPNPQDFDPESPPDSMVVMSMGTDTTDLIITNGIKLWMRNIPVGGNHFTKQLARELKLTHAKAEQLKRNARQAEDPKQLFKAMRPVFNDLVNEIQRSITFFSGLEKNAKISKMVLLGNAAKLPGLRQFLNTQLELDIAKVSEFRKLGGSEVTKENTFEENLLTFAPAYGLCIQGLKQAALRINLLPQEIQTERLIRQKKPWVLTAISLMLLGMLVGFAFMVNAWQRVHPTLFTTADTSWDAAKILVKAKDSESTKLMTMDAAQKKLLGQINTLNKELSSSSDKKTTWLELESVIYQALPKDPRTEDRMVPVDPFEIPYVDRKEIFVDWIETQFSKDLALWLDKVRPIYDNMFESSAEEAAQLVGVKPATGAPESTDEGATPPASPVSGPGWVVEIKGHHYHNSSKAITELLEARRTFVMKNFINRILNEEIVLPGDDNEIEGGGRYKYSDFGIYYPTIVDSDDLPKKELIVFDAKPVAPASGSGDSGRDDQRPESGTGGGVADESESNTSKETIPSDGKFQVDRFDFVVQFAWIPRSPRERFQARADRLKQEQAAATATAAGNAEDGETTPPAASNPANTNPPTATTPPANANNDDDDD